jgi:hypothetical protein
MFPHFQTEGHLFPINERLRRPATFNENNDNDDDLGQPVEVDNPRQLANIYKDRRAENKRRRQAINKGASVC